MKKEKLKEIFGIIRVILFIMIVLGFIIYSIYVSLFPPQRENNNSTRISPCVIDEPCEEEYDDEEWDSGTPFL